MRFDFSEEQRMLADSVRRALQALPITSVPPAGTTDDVEPSFEVAGKALTELGLFGLLVPEGQGGLGLGVTEATAVAMETGRAAVPFPVIESIAAMGIAARARPDICVAVLAGTAVLTAPNHGRLEASSGSRPSIHGRLSLPFAERARYLVAPVKSGSGSRTLLTELTGDRGVRTDGIDLTYPMSRLELSRAISANELVTERMDRVLGILATAELVGAAAHCLERTIAYMKERQQFGKVIGSFQALKHIAADCQVSLEGMKASVEYAAALHDRAVRSGDLNGDDGEAETAFRTAKAFCSEAGLKLAEQCIQLHGGIAFTWEYGLHLHFRRITRLANAHGTAYEHRDVLAGMALDGSKSYGGLAVPVQ
jgi:alkylation response protein AidB-like acyl-CoA dehydrogenase